MPRIIGMLLLAATVLNVIGKEVVMADETNQAQTPEVHRGSVIWEQLQRGLEENFPRSPRIRTMDEGAFWRFIVTASSRGGPAGGEVTLRKDTLVVQKVLLYQ